MKKFLVAGLAVVLALSLTSIASAANVYKVSAKASPSKSGTKKKPRAIQLDYGFKVSEPSGARPASLKGLNVKYFGVRFNVKTAPQCTFEQLSTTAGDANCPAGSAVAAGFARNIAGIGANRNDVSQRCYLDVKLYNGHNNNGALYVRGEPSANGPSDPKHCPLRIAVPIAVKITKSKTGDSLSFKIPESLQHPGLPTITNSLVETQLKVRRIVRKGKGYLETFGGCTKGKRKIVTTFENEDDPSVKNTAYAKCKK